MQVRVERVTYILLHCVNRTVNRTVTCHLHTDLHTDLHPVFALNFNLSLQRIARAFGELGGGQGGTLRKLYVRDKNVVGVAALRAAGVTMHFLKHIR